MNCFLYVDGQFRQIASMCPTHAKTRFDGLVQILRKINYSSERKPKEYFICQNACFDLRLSLADYQHYYFCSYLFMKINALPMELEKYIFQVLTNFGFLDKGYKAVKNIRRSTKYIVKHIKYIWFFKIRRKNSF